MSLFQRINEDARSDAGERHIKAEREYFAKTTDELKKLVEFADREKAGAEDSGRKSDYESIARKSRVLIGQLEKHLERYHESST